MSHPSAPLLLFSALLALGSAGCGQRETADPAVVAEHRSRLLLADEPDDAQTVVEVRNLMYGIEETAEVHDHDHEGEAAAADATVAEAQAPADDAGHDPAGEASSHDHDGDGQEDHAPEDHEEHEHEDGHAHDDHAHEGTGSAAKPVVSEMDVVLVGSVGGVANPSQESHPEFPFAKGKAVFFLVDPEAVAEMEEHEHKHAPGEECVFCEAHAGDSAHLLAVVQFADEQGKAISIDARDLFDLQEKETVVVRGKAKIDPSGMLVVDATGLYVRR